MQSDEDRFVRAAAVVRLAHLWKDDPDTLPLIKQLLQDRAENDPEKAIREFANKKLAELEKEN